MATPNQLAALRAAVPAAQASEAKWGVPASVTLAQWIIEASWGASQLAVQAHNLFGIKDIHRNIPDTYIEMPTAEYVSGERVLVNALFEKFPSDAACFDTHGRLLASAARYKPAMAVARNPFAFASALQRGGYSTSPVYADMLTKLIRQYNLTQYDAPPPAAGCAGGRMIQIKIAPAQYVAELKEVAAQTGELDMHGGTITHSGVKVRYSYDGAQVSIEVLSKPFFLKESYLESEITAWFAGS